jgi:hypothetical protein
MISRRSCPPRGPKKDQQEKHVSLQPASVQPEGSAADRLADDDGTPLRVQDSGELAFDAGEMLTPDSAPPLAGTCDKAIPVGQFEIWRA